MNPLLRMVLRFTKAWLNFCPIIQNHSVLVDGLLFSRDVTSVLPVKFGLRGGCGGGCDCLLFLYLLVLMAERTGPFLWVTNPIASSGNLEGLSKMLVLPQIF